MRSRATLAADSALLLTNLIWGTTFVIVKDILDYWPPVGYLMVRMALASLILVAILSRKIWRTSKAELKAGLLLGIILGGGYAGQAIGQVYTTPTKSAFITGLATPLVPVVSLVLLRLRPSVENVIGVVLASLGGALMFAPEADAGVNVGDLITLVCAILFALHIALACHYAKLHDTQRLTVLQIMAAAISLTILWLAIQLYINSIGKGTGNPLVVSEAKPLVWNARVFLAIIYLATVGTVVTYFLWTWGQARRSPTHVAIMFSLHPVFAAVIAVGVRGVGEWLGTRASIGAGLVFVSVIVTQIRWHGRRHNSGDNSNGE